MCIKNIFKKNKIEITYVKLNNDSVEFIKNVVIPELNITAPIGNKEIFDIEDWIYELEAIRYDDDGNKLILDENTELKIKQAQSLLADLMSIWDSENLVEDFDDLNEKLGLSLK